MRLLVPISFLLAAATLSPPAAAQDIEAYRKYIFPENTAAPWGGAVKITFLGTTTLLFDDGETQLMIDGFFSRPTLLDVVAGKIKTDAKAVDNVLKRARIDRLKALFVAHSHYDHAFDVAYVAQQTGAKLYGSGSTLNVGRGGDLREEQMALYEPGKEVSVGRFAVTVLKSKHSPPKAGINDDLGQPIDKPLRQPARFSEYKEGGSFDFLIRYGGWTVLVIPSSNYIEGALDDVRADVLFLGTGSFGLQTPKFKNAYYDHTVGKVRPKLVIPIHWDNFFKPLSDKLQAPGLPADDLSAGFDFLIERLAADKIKFGILQGYQSVLLFNDPPPCPEYRPVAPQWEPRRPFQFGFNRFHRR